MPKSDTLFLWDIHCSNTKSNPKSSWLAFQAKTESTAHSGMKNWQDPKKKVLIPTQRKNLNNSTDRERAGGTVGSDRRPHSKLHLRILLKILGRPKVFGSKTATLYIKLRCCLWALSISQTDSGLPQKARQRSSAGNQEDTCLCSTSSHNKTQPKFRTRVVFHCHPSTATQLASQEPGTIQPQDAQQDSFRLLSFSFFFF